MHLKTWARAAAVIAAVGSSAHADVLFGVDVADDVLVRIDASTGEVTVVGALGYDATNVELAWSGDQLYAVNSRFGLGSDLMRININNGAALDVTPITHGGAAALAVEGFAGDLATGQLVVSLRMGTGALWQANGLGALALDGTISGAIDTMLVNPIADWDALELIDSGLVGADGRPNGPDVVEVHGLSMVPVSANLRRSYSISDTFGSLNDFSWDGSRLFGIDTTLNQLVELDPLSLDIIDTTPLDGGYAIVGIAPTIVVPASGPAALLGLGGLLASRRRR